MGESEIPDKSSKRESGKIMLDLSGKGLQNMSSLPKHYSISDLILDNNSITKIERLDAFPKLCLLSIVNNHLVRMNGINFAKNLVSINLSNNGIVSMEGLCWLVHLEFLDLSRNNIKRVQNVSYCTKLKHIDLSENSISEISNLKSLVQLKVLLLHGNSISMLERAEENLPQQIETLSLSANSISDLNEVRHLSCLLNLKHFSIFDNPCVMKTASLPGFQCRTFLVSCVLSLLTLDQSTVTDSERQDAERLIQDDNLPLFTFGHHLQLVLYLSKICPSDSKTKITKDQNNLLEKFLQKRHVKIFTDQRNTEDTRSGLTLSSDVHHYGVRDVKASDTLQSSSNSVLEFSANTQNGSEHFSPDEDSDIDTLRSESRFLPVYSPLKKSPGRFQGSLSWEASPSDNVEDLSISTDDSPNMTHGLPIMTEEEANKLINLAATILQSHIRGFLVRRQFDYKKFKRVHTAASRIQALWRGYYFRNHSYQGLNFKNELRVRRLQKYIYTLGLIMQKSEKQHDAEKRQMLEIISLLYDKFTTLSDKVEGLESSKNEGEKMERKENDESRNSLEGTLHPVFFPHPRLLRNIDQIGNLRNNVPSQDDASNSQLSEDVGYSVEVDKDLDDVILQDYDSMNHLKVDKISDDVMEYHSEQVQIHHSEFEAAKEDFMDKRDTLMDQECLTEWGTKLQKQEDNREEDETIMHQGGNLYLTESDKESRSSEDNADHNDMEMDTDGYSKDVTIRNVDQESTNEVVYLYETSEARYESLPCNIPEDSPEKAPVRSINGDTRKFTVGDLCEPSEDVQGNEKKLVLETFQNIEVLHENCKAEEQLVPENCNVSASGRLIGKDCQMNEIISNDGEEQFDEGKRSCSSFENVQELKKDTSYGLIDKSDERILTNNVDGNVVVVVEEHGMSHESLEVRCEVFDQRTIATDVTPEVVSPVTDHIDGRSAEVARFAVVVSEVAKDELKHTDVEGKIVDDEGSSDDANRQGENDQRELVETMLNDSSKQRATDSESLSDEEDYRASEIQLEIEDENLEHKAIESVDNVKHTGKEKHSRDGGEFETFLNEVDGTIEPSTLLEWSNAEETRFELGEDTVQSSLKIPEVVDVPQMTSHEPAKVLVDSNASESLKDSLAPIRCCSLEVGAIVDFTDDSEGIEEKLCDQVNQSSGKVESYEIPVILGNNDFCNECREGRQNGESERSESNTSKMESCTEASTHNEEDCGLGNLEQETAIVSGCEIEIKITSPKLREPASSLLSALKDEITGVSSMSHHSEESLSTSHTPVSHASSGWVGHPRDAEPDSTSDLAPFESQDVTNVHENNI